MLLSMIRVTPQRAWPINISSRVARLLAQRWGINWYVNGNVEQVPGSGAPVAHVTKFKTDASIEFGLDSFLKLEVDFKRRFTPSRQALAGLCVPLPEI